MVNELLYRELLIPKSSGGFRKLEEPNPLLKAIQRNAAQRMKIRAQELRIFPAYVTGSFGTFSGTHNTSRYHVGKSVILKLDIEDFFGSVTTAAAAAALQSELNMDNLMAFALANMCTVNNHLPQGSPASPILANLAALSMHRKMQQFAASVGAIFSVYVDDMYISAPWHSEFGSDVTKVLNRAKEKGIKTRKLTMDIMLGLLADKPSNVFKSILDIAAGFGFRLKSAKAKLMLKGSKQQIMDVCVAEAPTWGTGQHIRMSRTKRKQMLSAIHNLYNLKPRESLPHIRGLVCQAKRLGDQSYTKAKAKFDEACKRWREYLAEHPVKFGG